MAYTSVVDYLKAQGQASDYTSRSKLASQYGISNYTGTAAQNTQLLSALQKPVATPTIPKSPTLPTGINLNYTGALSTPSTTAPTGNYASTGGGGSWGSSTPTSNLFSVSGNTQNGVVTNSSGFQIPKASTGGTPTYGPYLSEIKSPQSQALYSPTVTGNQTPTQNFSAQSVDFFNQASKPASTPSLPSTFDISSYSQGTGFNLPESKPATPDYSALLNSIRIDPQTSQRMTDLDVSIQEMMKGSTDTSLLDQQKQALDLQGRLGARGQKQFEAEKTAGVFDLQKQLNDVNSQIQQLQKENEITKLNAQGQPIAQEEINKQTADADRRYAVKALGLSAIAQTIQGNLALAQDYASKSVEAEFAPLEAQLDYLKLALEYNKENFTREEKKRAEQLALMIDERERILETEKADKKSVFGIMQTAVEAGADAKTLNAIINARTPEEALLAGASVFQVTAEDLSNAKVFGDSTGGYFRLDAYGNAIPLTQGVGKPATAEQYKAAGFYDRVSNSGKIISDLESKMYYIGALGASVSAIQNNLPRWLQSSERKQMEQAQRDFINAVLRRESGAAIAESEFENAALQYFPQPGDDPGTLAQKKKNRDIVINNLQREAGSAIGGQPNISQAFDMYGGQLDQDGKLLGFTNALGMALNGLGSLSEKYESGGNPGAIGYDSTGGYSYGAFQLAHNNAKSFIDQSPYKQAFQGLTFNSPEWRNRWKQVAQQDPNGFYNAQKAYIAKTHFEPQVQKLSSIGLRIDQLSPATLNAVWSTAVQHGPNTNIVANAVKKLPQGATEADLIKQIYTDRWAGGANFASSTPQVRQSVYNRFFGANGELNTALSMLS